MKRSEAREALMGLLFETEFHADDGAENIFDVSCAARDIEEDDYIRTAYFGIYEHLEEIDNIIGEHSNGWKTYRISGIAKAAMRICIWEMLYADDIPSKVSINEALEIVKKYDNEKIRPFVNGVLNSAKNMIEGGKSEQ